MSMKNICNKCEMINIQNVHAKRLKRHLPPIEVDKRYEEIFHKRGSVK